MVIARYWHNPICPCRPAKAEHLYRHDRACPFQYPEFDSSHDIHLSMNMKSGLMTPITGAKLKRGSTYEKDNFNLSLDLVLSNGDRVYMDRHPTSTPESHASRGAFYDPWRIGRTHTLCRDCDRDHRRQSRARCLFQTLHSMEG